MTKAKKERIDKMWMETEYGKWILASASGKEKEAEELKKKLTEKYPWVMDFIDDEMSAKIAEQFKTFDEYNEYLRMLDEENYDLVEFMIAADIFGAIYKILK